MKFHLQMAVTRAKMGNYTFVSPSTGRVLGSSTTPQQRQQTANSASTPPSQGSVSGSLTPSQRSSRTDNNGTPVEPPSRRQPQTRRQRQNRRGPSDNSNSSSVPLLAGMNLVQVPYLPSVEEEEEDGNSSSSDDGSQLVEDDNAYDSDMDTNAGSASDDDNNNEDDAGIAEEWNWEELPSDLQMPEITNKYDGPHGLKPGVEHKFNTVSECIFETSGLLLDVFRRMTAQSNKYARAKMRNGKFGGLKWTNITLQEMIRFFGIMLRMSIEPRHLGGYEAYFHPSTSIQAGKNYSVQLSGYVGWAATVMSLGRFRQIRSAFHPEAGISSVGDKCHQLRFLIRSINSAAARTFDLGPRAAFDEGGIATRSRFCCVRQYNKDKPAKFRIDFFVLADSEYYFVRHIDVYQGKNAGNIDVAEQAKNLPTTMKAVVNAVIASGMANDPDGARELFFDNRYAAPELCALLQEELNVYSAGTCRANRIGFPGKDPRLVLSSRAERGTFQRLYCARFNMIATRWKDSKTLQFISNLRITDTNYE